MQDGGKVKKGDTFVQWDPYNVPILSEKAGKVKFHDIIEGVTMKQEMDEQTQQEAMVNIEHKEDLHPQIVIVGDKKEVLASYSIPAGAHVIVEEDQKIRAGALLANRDDVRGFPVDPFRGRVMKAWSAFTRNRDCQWFAPSSTWPTMIHLHTISCR